MLLASQDQVGDQEDQEDQDTCRRDHDVVCPS